MRVEAGRHHIRPGVVEEGLGRLLMPFERLDAEAWDISGTGLGLSLSRSLAEAMGGRLDVASTPGQGSTLSVTLRLEVPAATAAPDTSQEVGHRPLSRASWSTQETRK